jgi:hypothetical protein
MVSPADDPHRSDAPAAKAPQNTVGSRGDTHEPDVQAPNLGPGGESLGAIWARKPDAARRLSGGLRGHSLVSRFAVIVDGYDEVARGEERRAGRAKIAAWGHGACVTPGLFSVEGQER